MSSNMPNISGITPSNDILKDFNSNAKAQPAPDLLQKPDTFEKQVESAPTQPKSISAKKVAGIVLASTLAGIGATVLFMKGRNKEAMETFQKTSDEAIEAAQKASSEAIEAVQKQSEEAINAAQERLDKLKLVLEGKYEESYMQKLKDKIDNFELDYDPKTPPIKEVNLVNAKNAIEFTPLHKTSNRANMQELVIPEFNVGSKFEFNMPSTSAVKPSVIEQSAQFTPIANAETSMSLNYAKSVKWDNDKISRDILQNFYDGHGQTLDGVNMVFEPVANGRYKVRIAGKGTYSPDKAVLIGESGKRNNASAAGNYGEGLKMTVLKILKDCGAKNVDIVSDNWKVAYSIGNSSVGNEKVLSYSLDKLAKPYNGNYFEFETDNIDLLKSLRKSVNNFYHSSNTDFKSPDFENAVMGIKTLPKGQKGAVYISGQKFEFDGGWNNVEGANIFFKEKPPEKMQYNKYGGKELVFDPSRDRTSLNSGNLQNIAKYFAFNEKTSSDEVVQALRSLEKYWEVGDDVKNSPLKKVVSGLVDGAYSKGIKVKFPNNYISITSNTSDDLIQKLKSQGYVLCDERFDSIGMQNITDFLNTSRNHNVFTPDAVQTKKIGLIREALQSLSKRLDNKEFFDGDELKPKIYLFDRLNSKETKSTESALAEAIIKPAEYFYDNEFNYIDIPQKSLGFWADRDYFNNVSFEEILSTALHELTHKAGGDSSSEFSYKLTDVLTKVIESGVGDEDTVQELRVIKKLWDELPKTTPA